MIIVYLFVLYLFISFFFFFEQCVGFMPEKLFSTPFSFSFHFILLFVCCALVSVNRSLLLRTYSHIHNDSTQRVGGATCVRFRLIDHVAITYTINIFDDLASASAMRSHLLWRSLSLSLYLSLSVSRKRLRLGFFFCWNSFDSSTLLSLFVRETRTKMGKKNRFLRRAPATATAALLVFFFFYFV